MMMMMMMMMIVMMMIVENNILICICCRKVDDKIGDPAGSNNVYTYSDGDNEGGGFHRCSPSRWRVRADVSVHWEMLYDRHYTSIRMSCYLKEQ